MEIPLELFGEADRRTPHICHVKPSDRFPMSLLEEAGGIPAVMKELVGQLGLSMLIVSGKTKTLGANLRKAEVLD
jgi:dihydroxy-acid dehydratase